MSDEQRSRLDDTTFFWGAVIGFVVGALVWFFRVPRRGTETRERIAKTGQDLITRDSVEESLQEGRALARQRLENAPE